MDRISKEQIDVMIDFAKLDLDLNPGFQKHCILMALVELRERRAADKGPQRTVQEQWCGREK
jgi:hypothetical protein